MRVGVIGAGAVGGAIAALLDRAGHFVTVTARSSVPVIARDGLVLTGAFGDAVARVHAVPALVEQPDIAILATKVHDTAAAISASAAALEGVPLLSVQNGLGGERRVAALLGHDRVAAGITTWASNSVTPGSIHVTAAGDTLIGGSEAAAFLALLEPVMPRVSELDNVTGAQWTKLVINTSNAVPAATGMSMQECVNDERLLRVIARAMREAAAVGIAHNIEFGRVGAATAATVHEIAQSQSAAEALPRAMANGFGEVPNLGSTLQSIMRGETTEVDALSGAVVTAAAGTGIPTPVNAGLVALVHRVESTGRFVSADRVAALAL